MAQRPPSYGLGVVLMIGAFALLAVAIWNLTQRTSGGSSLAIVAMLFVIAATRLMKRK